MTVPPRMSFDRLPAELPIFPLAGVLLLPRGQLPLNIFEPRYLMMFDDAMASNRVIGMVQPAFGDKGLSFELLVWPTREAVKRPAAMHAAYTWLIADALDAAGVEVPVSQTDIRLRAAFGMEGEDALQRLGYGVRPAPGGFPQRSAPTANDAADDVMAAAREEMSEGEPDPPADRQGG